MQTNLIHIPHQNGELIASLNENYEAALCDYIGNAKVLYLSASISHFDEDGETVSYDISPTIPDLSFGSCSDVEILVCGFETHFEFGDFAFLHCNNSIIESGLVPKSRLYVHLSKDNETARSVGVRHGTPVIFTVMSGQMFKDGYLFYCSRNGVWLTKHVPPKYLKVL